MSELGRLLGEARTTKKLSLADVEATIRVRQKYLEALECGDFAALPPGAITRGLLRNYAHFLGLDSSEVMQLYVQESGDRNQAVPLADPEQVRAADYRPLEVTLINDQPARNWGSWLVALLIVIVVSLAAWWYLSHQSGTSFIPVRDGGPLAFLSAFGPQRTPTVAATVPATRGLITVTPPVAPPTTFAPIVPGQPTPTEGSGSPTPTSDLLTLPITTTQPTPTTTPTPRPTATPEATAGISLTLQTTQRTWLKVTTDGNVVMQELVESGQTRGWPANQQVSVLTGNAAGVQLRINGQDLGVMGGVGQVLERIWAVDQGKIVETTPKSTASPVPTVNPTAPS
jgi:cytoskeleton protein RodZ